MKERQFGLVEVMACLRFSLFGNPVSKSHRTKTHELSRKVSVAWCDLVDRLLVCSIRETVLCAIAMQKLFEKAFIRKGRHVVRRTEFVHQWQRNSPGHPLTSHVC